MAGAKKGAYLVSVSSLFGPEIGEMTLKSGRSIFVSYPDHLYFKHYYVLANLYTVGMTDVNLFWPNGFSEDFSSKNIGQVEPKF